MTDKLLAIVALLTLMGFVGIVVAFVREVDLTIVCVAVLIMAAVDFFLLTFRKDRSEE